jgi:hypothetical protein
MRRCMPGLAARARRAPLADVALATALLVGTVLYLRRWPPDLISDEGLYLYVAKRLLAGDVLYRDLFVIVTPLSYQAMAAAFWALGTTLTTARVVTALLVGAIAVVVYRACRTLGVRRSLSCAAGMVPATLAYPALFIASPHWLGTLATVVLLHEAIARRWAGRALGAAVPGVVAGILIGTQQQKGAVLTAGFAILLVVDALLDRRYGRRGPGLRRTIAAFVAGVLVVVVPLGGALLASVGARPLLEALVVFPLVHYRQYNRTTWGFHAPFLAGSLYILPRAVAWLPLAAPAAALSVIPSLAARADERRVRALALAAGFGMLTICSVAYFPDYTHLAIITPVFAVLVAAVLERGARYLEHARRAPAFGTALALMTILALGVQLRQTLAQHAHFIVGSRNTPIGRVDFWRADEIAVVDKVRELIGEHPDATELFCYPNCATMYLATGTLNPTPFDTVLPGYSPAEHVQRTLAILESHSVPYVVVTLPLSLPWREDPVIRYLTGRYERVKLPSVSRVPGMVLFRRPGTATALN